MSRPPPSGAEAAERRQLKAAMRAYAQPRDAAALALVLSDGVAYLSLVYLSAVAPWLWLKLLLAPLIALFVVRLFIIGHDADHGAFVSSRLGNRLIAYAVFLPGLVSKAGWNFGHNVHHSFANTHGLDTTWSPLTLQEYRRRSAFGRWWERAQRAPLGQGLHVFGGVLTVVVLTLIRFALGRTSRTMARDSAIVVAFLACLIGATLSLSAAADVALWKTALGTLLAPTLIWFTAGGIIVYLNHTDPDIAWYPKDAAERWDPHAISLDHTTNVVFPLGLHRVMHDVMEHVPHHVNTKIPCYRLRAARQEIERLFPGRLRTIRIGLTAYLAIVRRCKLYDLERGCWTDFAGQPTTARTPQAMPQRLSGPLPAAHPAA